MLSNAYSLAKFRFDSAENEPAKNLLIFPILLTLTPKPGAAPHRPGTDELSRWRPLRRPGGARAVARDWWHYAARGALLTVSPHSALFGWISFWLRLF